LAEEGGWKGLPENETRRTLVVDLIPYLLGAYLKAQSTLTPAALLSRAMESYGERGREIANHREALSAALRGVQDLNLRPEGEGFVFEVDRKMMLGVARLRLTKAYIREGSHGSPFIVDPPGFGPSVDAVLKLPMQSVFVKLLPEELTNDVEADLLEAAVRMAPSQLWVLTLEDSNEDSRLNPQFRSENKALFGRLRILGMGRVLEDYLGGAYEIELRKWSGGFQVKATPE